MGQGIWMVLKCFSLDEVLVARRKKCRDFFLLSKVVLHWGQIDLVRSDVIFREILTWEFSG